MADADTSDDGVTFLTPLVTDNTAQVLVNASADAILDAWIDLNLDGVWDATEKVIDGFWPAFWGGLVIALVTMLLSWLAGDRPNVNVVVRRGPP